MSSGAAAGKDDEFGPARPRWAVADPAQVGPQAAHAAGRRARPGLFHPEPARPLVTDQPHTEEENSRGRRVDAVLGFAEHAEQPGRAELDRTLADTGPTRCVKHRRRPAFRDDDPRQRSTRLPEPGDDPVQRRRRRDRLLLEERLLPGDHGGLDAGHGEALRHGTPDPAAFAGDHELSRGGAVVTPCHRQRPEVGCRGPGEHGARSLDQPVFWRRTRLLHRGLRRDAPLDGELAAESRKGNLLPEKGPARRTRVPQHQVVHRHAAGELGGRQ